MSELWDALTLTQNTFLRYAFLAGLLSSVSCGVVGSFVVARRITYIAGGIAHCILGGMGLARYLAVTQNWDFIRPLHGAAFAALAAAYLIGWVSLHAKEREDTVIGALWSVGMAAGLLFIAKTPGYHEDLMGYLFGNILMVSAEDLWMIFILDVLVLAIVLLFFNQLEAVCFDEEFARVRGLNVTFYYQLLLALTAITVVLLIAIVGIVMVIALLTLPAAVAGQFSKSLHRMMISATLLCAAFTTAGLAISYQPSLPSGPTIIVLTGIAYLCAVLFRNFKQKALRGRS